MIRDPHRRSRRRWLLAATGAAGLIAAWLLLLLRGEPATPHPLFEALPDRPLVIAHRGSAILAPENTLAAFEFAIAIGADLLEMDLRTTADGEIVILHDPTVDRTTDGTGVVSGLSLQQIRRLDAGYRFSPPGSADFPERGKGNLIPTLDEVLSAFPGARLNLELKESGPALALSLCERIRHHRAGDRVLVASFHASAVREFRRQCPEAATSATRPEAKRFLLASFVPGRMYVPNAHALQLPVRYYGYPVTNRRTAQAARRANLQLHAFTINDVETMRRLLELGVDGLVTDRPDLAVPLVERRAIRR